MQKNILNEDIHPFSHEPVRFKDMGNVMELMYSKKGKNTVCSILKIDEDHYIDLKTGEVKVCNHIDNRSENKNTVRVSLGKLRDLINTNVTNTDFCRWVTLTYAENMTDTKRLYEDFKKFIKRMHYKGYDFEYIVAIEPQGRGAWHAHMIMIFKEKAPFIPNEELFKIWGHGFVTIKKLDDVDNVGAYLTAYLGDMELEEFHNAGLELKSGNPAKVIDFTDENGNKVTKSFIKGARLVLYPPKFNLYRCSRGIKKPTVEYMSEQQAQKKVGALTPTYERTIQICDPIKDYDNVLNYRQYNKKRKEKQE